MHNSLSCCLKHSLGKKSYNKQLFHKVTADCIDFKAFKQILKPVTNKTNPNFSIIF